MENDGSFVPQCYGVDISLSPIYRNEFCELVDTRIFDRIFEGSWCRHWKISTDGERWQVSFHSVTVLISPEVLFTGMNSVN